MIIIDANSDVIWEQRRYEIAKDAMVGIIANSHDDDYRVVERGPFSSDARKAYSIGELIEMLPKHIEIKSEWCRLDIYPTKNKWHIDYDNIVFKNLAKTAEIELIDALYDMILRLKEKEVI